MIHTVKGFHVVNEAEVDNIIYLCVCVCIYIYIYIYIYIGMQVSYPEKYS